MANETTLVILGASGDLTSRLLLPALGQLLTMEPHRRVRLRGAGIDDWDDERWRDTVRTSFAAGGFEQAFAAVAETTYQRADITDPGDLQRLIADPGGRVALYFAVPPAVAAAAC
jgi:glucose-6-phosphate 1-dehydrogenase